MPPHSNSLRGPINHFWLCVTAWQTSVGGINENQFLTLYSNAPLLQGVWGDDDRVSDFSLHIQWAARPSALPKDSPAPQRPVCYSLASTGPAFVWINDFFTHNRRHSNNGFAQFRSSSSFFFLLLDPLWNFLMTLKATSQSRQWWSQNSSSTFWTPRTAKKGKALNRLIITFTSRIDEVKCSQSHTNEKQHFKGDINLQLRVIQGWAQIFCLSIRTQQSKQLLSDFGISFV